MGRPTKDPIEKLREALETIKELGEPRMPGSVMQLGRRGGGFRAPVDVSAEEWREAYLGYEAEVRNLAKDIDDHLRTGLSREERDKVAKAEEIAHRPPTKGKVRCPECGTGQRNQAKRCDQCGAPVLKSA